MSSLTLIIRFNEGGLDQRELGPHFGQVKITDTPKKLLLEVGSEVELGEINKVLGELVAAGSFPIHLIYALYRGDSMSVTSLTLNDARMGKGVRVVIPNAQKDFEAKLLED